ALPRRLDRAGEQARCSSERPRPYGGIAGGVRPYLRALPRLPKLLALGKERPRGMTQQRTHRTLLGIAAAAVLIATACAPSGGPSASSTTTTQETPVAGGRVIRGSFSDIRVLNPVVSTDATSTQVISLMYDTLINVDPKTGTPVPWMGKWTVSADNQTFPWA